MASELKNKYLSAKVLIEYFKDIDHSRIKLMSTDSYNESLIMERIESTGRKIELAACAVNMSCVGFGNKKYGSVEVDGKILSIEKVLSECGVQLRNDANKTLRDDDLTPQRICRFFRHNTRLYLQNSRYPTYMFRKYSDRNAQFFDICFRGAEYLSDLSDEEQNYLIKIADNMDENLNTNISNRMKRVFEAQKGYFVIPI